MDLQDKMARMLTGADETERPAARVTTGVVKAVSGYTASCLLAGDVSTLNPVDTCGVACSVGDSLSIVGRPGRWIAVGNITTGATTFLSTLGLKSPNLDKGTTPSSTAYGEAAYSMKDKDGETIGYVRPYISSAGLMGLQVEAAKTSGSTKYYACAGPNIDSSNNSWFSPNNTTKMANTAHTVAIYPSTTTILTQPSAGPARVYGLANLFYNSSGVNDTTAHSLNAALSSYALAEVYYGNSSYGYMSTRILSPANKAVSLPYIYATSTGGTVHVATATLTFATAGGASTFTLSNQSCKALATGSSAAAGTNNVIKVYGVWGFLG